MKPIKKILISALILLIPVLTFGQQNFASISFGTSTPLKEYSEVGDLTKNGYATTGASIKFDAAYFPVSYLGIGGSFGFGTNPGRSDSLKQDMIDYVLNNSQSIIDIPDYAETYFNSGFWNYINVFLGPHFSVRPAKRLYLDLRFLAGLSVIRPPDQELSIIFDETEIYFDLCLSLHVYFATVQFTGLSLGNTLKMVNDLYYIMLFSTYFRHSSIHTFSASIGSRFFVAHQKQ